MTTRSKKLAFKKLLKRDVAFLPLFSFHASVTSLDYVSLAQRFPPLFFFPFGREIRTVVVIRGRRRKEEGGG